MPCPEGDCGANQHLLGPSNLLPSTASGQRLTTPASADVTVSGCESDKTSATSYPSQRALTGHSTRQFTHRPAVSSTRIRLNHLLIWLATDRNVHLVFRLLSVCCLDFLNISQCLVCWVYVLVSRLKVHSGTEEVGPDTRHVFGRRLGMT